MNRIFENQVHVDLVVWETDPKLRNNSTISFYVPITTTVNEGDVILCKFSAEGISAYILNTIVNTKQGSIKGKNHITAQVSYITHLSKLNLSQFDTEYNSAKFHNFFNIPA